ncbi:MAG TPA: response regulator [Bryobacteraceae bacterium]|jgi:DNA-binding response OmpR family regulator
MHRKKTILLVDADPRDRQFMRGLLEEEGFAVIEAVDYWDAVDMHRAHPGGIDLLLTALSLPSNNGYELARTLFQEDAHLKTLFVSARAGAEVSPYYHMPMTGRHMLAKPLSADELRERVRAIFRKAPRRFTRASRATGSNLPFVSHRKGNA